MSSLLEQQLQLILTESIENGKFDKAEESIVHLRKLAGIKDFITIPSSEPPVPAAEEKDETKKNPEAETLILYYIAEDALIKIKKQPQTYTAAEKFFMQFLTNLEQWKTKSPFTAKDYYEQFYENLQPLTKYQSSTLKQFVTLLFRFVLKMEVLQKTEYHQKGRVIVDDHFQPAEVMNHIKQEKILML
ncbi:hypothetical protein [Salibacterium aidingense]|uniref:hypothetical protein n=1 Tax=Salibacterium aidingense TaxID=384933 RepID=UPI003BEE6F31